MRISSRLSLSFSISFIFYLFGFSYSRHLYMSFYCSACITSVSEWNQSWLQYHLKSFFATFQHNLKCQTTAEPTYLNLCHFKIRWDYFSNTQKLQNFKLIEILWSHESHLMHSYRYLSNNHFFDLNKKEIIKSYPRPDLSYIGWQFMTLLN